MAKVKGPPESVSVIPAALVQRSNQPSPADWTGLHFLEFTAGFVTFSLGGLGKALAGTWNSDGASATAEKGENPSEVIISCTRDPWPSWAKEYGVPMEEVALSREKLFQSIIEDVSLFFNIPLKIEMLKAIPRGQGETVLKLYKTE